MITSLTLQIYTSKTVARFPFKRKGTCRCSILTGILQNWPLNSVAQCYHTSSNPLALPRCPLNLLLTQPRAGLIYASTRRSGRSKDVSTRDAFEMVEGTKSFGQASSWLPESGSEKALMLQSFDGGESTLRNLVFRTPPRAREKGE